MEQERNKVNNNFEVQTLISHLIIEKYYIKSIINSMLFVKMFQILLMSLHYVLTSVSIFVVLFLLFIVYYFVVSFNFC